MKLEEKNKNYLAVSNTMLKSIAVVPSKIDPPQPQISIVEQSTSAKQFISVQ
jgi:hypothetical protein